MHPQKKSAIDSHNAKLKAMTSDYGAASGPANNIMAPPERGDGDNPDAAVGFGEGAPSRARGDRAARRPALANPIPTYAKGGGVDRARGGRAKGKGATHVNVIVAPQGGAGAGAMPPPMMPPPIPPGGGMPPPPKPPMGAGPMGAPPGGGPIMPPPPGMPPPGMMPPRARGGRVKHADEAEDRKLISEMLRKEEKGEEKKRARGGSVTDDEDHEDRIGNSLREEGLTRFEAGTHVKPGKMPHMEGGAATGIGRLDKIGEKPKRAGRPQTV
jgi:hypothetical protein